MTDGLESNAELKIKGLIPDFEPRTVPNIANEKKPALPGGKVMKIFEIPVD